jgi:ketosteroid isomerase-like protein
MEALCTDEPEVAGIRAALEQTSYAGPGAVRRFWADATEVWSERRLDVEEIDERGDDTVVVRAVWHGRGRGSGVDVEREIGFHFRLEAGRIASVRTFVNPEDAG